MMVVPKSNFKNSGYQTITHTGGWSTAGCILEGQRKESRETGSYDYSCMLDFLTQFTDRAAGKDAKNVGSPDNTVTEEGKNPGKKGEDVP